MATGSRPRFPGANTGTCSGWGATAAMPTLASAACCEWYSMSATPMSTVPTIPGCSSSSGAPGPAGEPGLEVAVAAAAAAPPALGSTSDTVSWERTSGTAKAQR